MPWQLGIPNLGGGAYAQVGQAISEAAKGVGDTIQQSATANDLIKTMGQSGLLDPHDRGNNDKLMQSLAGKSLGAKQQFLGGAMTAYQTYQNQMAENQAAQKQLQWFSRPENAGALGIKMNMMQPNPGQRPAYGYGSNGPTPPGQTQTPNVESPQTPNQPAPTISSDNGGKPYQPLTETRTYNGVSVNYHKDASGNVIGATDQNGNIIQPDQLKKLLQKNG